jgi:hypothetical protein
LQRQQVTFTQKADEEPGTEAKTLEAQINFVVQQHQQEQERLSSFGGASGDLKIRAAELEGLEREFATVRNSIFLLEMELDGPARIQVVQPATRTDIDYSNTVLSVAH